MTDSLPADYYCARYTDPLRLTGISNILILGRLGTMCPTLVLPFKLAPRQRPKYKNMVLKFTWMTVSLTSPGRQLKRAGEGCMWDGVRFMLCSISPGSILPPKLRISDDFIMTEVGVKAMGKPGLLPINILEKYSSIDVYLYLPIIS